MINGGSQYIYDYVPECHLGEGDIIMFDEILISKIELLEGRFQTFPDIFLPEKLTRKSRRFKNKTFIRGASPGIPWAVRQTQHRLAKMENCYSRKNSLWYGSWNRHVCHILQWYDFLQVFYWVYYISWAKTSAHLYKFPFKSSTIFKVIIFFSLCTYYLG